MKIITGLRMRPLICAAMLSSLLWCGCVSTRETEQIMMGRMERGSYPPLERYKLALEMGGVRVFPAGKAATLEFSLTNLDRETVEIREWYKQESDNLRIYCQLWTPDMQSPDPQEWTEIILDHPVDSALRAPLVLTPGSKAWISRPLEFVEALSVSPDCERRYFVRAELNLKSVNVQSEPAAIAIVPAKE